MTNEHVEQTVAKIRKKRTAESTPATGVTVHAETQTPLPVSQENFACVAHAVGTIGENRPWVIQTILAIYASTFMDERNPLWLMLIGNPSSNKTTLVELLNVPDVYRLDTVTGNPFSSGQKETDAS